MGDDFKQITKGWLRAQNRDREWLAEKLGKKLQTINNWLSTAKPIPENCIDLIKRLMADDEAAEKQRHIQLQPQAQIFSLEVELPRFRAYNAAALKANKTLEQWSITELNAAAEAALASEKREETPPPEDTTPETTERETEIAGQKLKIIGPTNYTQTPPSEERRVAEE